MSIDRAGALRGGRGSRSFWWRPAAALVVAGTMLGAAPLLAQDGGEDEAAEGEGTKPAADAKGAAWTKVEQEAKGFRDALKAGGAFDGAVRDFIAKRAVPQLASDSNRSIIDRVRRQLRDFPLAGIADDRVFDDVSKGIADAAVAIARDGDASRPARVNAMLLVGDLRGKDGKEGTVWSPAAGPLAAVASDPSIDLSVRVAAMAGLSRHADAARKAGGDKQTEFAKAARPAVVAIVAEAPSDTQPVASDWLASRALALVTAVTKSSPKDFAATLAKIAADPARSLDVRVRAAGALGATATAKSEIQAVETVGTITDLGIAVLEADEGILRDRRYEQQLGGGSGAPGGMGMGMGMMMSRPPVGGGSKPGVSKFGPGMPGSPGSPGSPGAPGMTGMAEVEVPQLVPDQALRRTAWRLNTLADSLLTEDGKAGVAALLSGNDKENSKAYAKLFREHAEKIDEARTDDSLLEAIAAIRPDDSMPATEGELPVDGVPAAPKPAVDENDPFGGK